VTKISRREFIEIATAFAALSLADRSALANPLGLPLGIQLYSVRQQMAEDLDATLVAVRAAGYIEVEAASLPKKPAKDIRTSLNNAGLRCVSAHHSLADLRAHLDEIVDYDKELGVGFIICSSPGFREQTPATPGHRTMSLVDWQYTAEQLNAYGEKSAKSGIRIGYHNHTPEFAQTDGKIPYMELLRLTDPAKVTFELDCGWAMVASMKPTEILKEHPHRISMLHVKDFKIPANPSPEAHDFKVTELGQGNFDYHPIFQQAAKTQHIEHAFVEQEAFDMPWKESLKVDAEYMRTFRT
jgi:sugar phosphate isomerase/epimerase